MLTDTRNQPSGEEPGSGQAVAARLKDDKEFPDTKAAPTINGKATILSVYSPSQLKTSPFLPDLHQLVNAAFEWSHSATEILNSTKRLSHENQYIEELGDDPETFVLIVRFVDTDQIIATAYASRYLGVASVPDDGQDRTWKRIGLVPDDADAWELRNMVVHPRCQSQGLAQFLMKTIEDGVKIASDAAARSIAQDNPRPRRLLMYLATVKEIQGGFYLKRGYREDYSVEHPSGHLGSVKGFSVVFMSKEIGA